MTNTPPSDDIFERIIRVHKLNAVFDELFQKQHEDLIAKIKLNESTEWYSIKRMEKLNPGREFCSDLLKEASKKLGKEVKTAIDVKYGEVDVYHILVWKYSYFGLKYPIAESEHFFRLRFRK